MKRNAIFLTVMGIFVISLAGTADAKGRGKKAGQSKVTIDLHVMSQCPYGVETMQNMKKVKDAFGDDVNINLHYIGRVKKGKPTSMHGEKEVQGDINQLCARDVATSDAQFWKYLACVNDKWREIPEHDAACAEEAELNQKKFARCKKKKGKRLIKKSFNASEKAKATGSPTIVINGEKYSGGRTDTVLAQYICAKHNDDKSMSACNNLAPPVAVTAYAITDKRCGEQCDVARQIASLKNIFMGLKPVIVDWSEPRAKEMMQTTNTKKLPAVLFTDSVLKDNDGYAHMKKWLTKVGPYHTLKLKAEFDPAAEICDNKIDDTGNGKVDCADATCKEALPCRPEKPKQLELFVMGQCPFAARAVLAMKTVFKKLKNDVDLQIHFIGKDNDGELTSMHGQTEVAEDMRWLCAKKAFPADYMKYVTCRAKDPKSANWKKCARGKIKAADIESCVESGEGKRMLAQDFKVADRLNIGASPSWIVNGHQKFSGVTAKAILENYCKANPGVKGCR